MDTKTRACNDCGRDHLRYRGGSAVYCDWAQGKPSPSVDDNRQWHIAQEFERRHPDEAASIRTTLRAIQG